VTHAVFVTPNVSAEPRTGATLRTHRLLEGLAREMAVDVVAVHQEVDADGLRRSTGVRSVVAAPIRNSPIRKRAVAVRNRWPLAFARLWDDDARATVDRLAEGGVVVLDHVFVAPYRPERGPYVLSTHNVEAQVLRDLPPPASIARRLERRWELAVLPRREREVLGDPRATVVVVSDADAASVTGEVVVVPNGADVPEDAPCSPRGGGLLFVGSLDYEPNRAALAWWVEEVTPHLSPRLPVLTVVGRDPGRLGRLAGDPHLRCVGEVADVVPYLREASVVVVPLQHGGGTRLKVLEALAWARPVVTTTKGSEGLPLVDGTHARFADTPSSFAEATLQLWQDADLADRLARAGRELAERYSWPDLARQFAAVVRSIGTT
jgi:glycosyltransferase involved in cell wall biosynthesis